MGKSVVRYCPGGSLTFAPPRRPTKPRDSVITPCLIELQYPQSRASAISHSRATLGEHDDAASARPHFDSVTSIRHALAHVALMRSVDHRLLLSSIARYAVAYVELASPVHYCRVKGYGIRRDASQVDPHSHARLANRISRQNAPWWHAGRVSRFRRREGKHPQAA